MIDFPRNKFLLLESGLPIHFSINDIQDDCQNQPKAENRLFSKNQMKKEYGVETMNPHHKKICQIHNISASF